MKLKSKPKKAWSEYVSRKNYDNDNSIFKAAYEINNIFFQCWICLEGLCEISIADKCDDKIWLIAGQRSTIYECQTFGGLPIVVCWWYCIVIKLIYGE